jgi:tetratricopeptide (TPR) repeat protein
VTLLDRLGERAGAIEAYNELARRLESEFGAVPSPETVDLMQRVRARSVVGAHVGGPLAAAPAAPSLPAPGIGIGAPARGASRLLFAIATATAIATAVYLAGFTIGPRGAEPEPPRARRAAVSDSILNDRLLRGRHALSRRGKAGLLEAAGHFSAALDRSPRSAEAYAGLADAYVQLGYGSLMAPEEAFPRAREAALRAVELDSSLAAPHAALGFERLYFAWDWPGAEREFRHAIALDPDHATTHEWFGLFLTAMGRFTEAQAAERQARQIDPLSNGIAGTAAWVYHYSGRDAEAEGILRVALLQDTSYELGRLYLARVLQARGMLDSATAYYRSLRRLEAWVPSIAGIGVVHAEAGRSGEARRTLARMDSLARTEYVTSYGRALVYAALGEQDSAFYWLDRGVAERTHWLVWLNRDRRWDGMRTDPRFARLTERIGLPP